MCHGHWRQQHIQTDTRAQQPSQMLTHNKNRQIRFDTRLRWQWSSQCFQSRLHVQYLTTLSHTFPWFRPLSTDRRSVGYKYGRKSVAVDTSFGLLSSSSPSPSPIKIELVICSYISMFESV